MATLTVDVTVPRRDFDVRVSLVADEAVAIVGPSGAGKTTVLRAIAGLERPAAGCIRLGDTEWFRAPSVELAPERRGVGYVFQEFALFEHLTVAGNVGFGAKRGGQRWLDALGIAHLASAMPRALSGGERQRVALARALAREPDVLLMDEPSGSLDVLTRQAVRAELAAIVANVGRPTVIVTHDFTEAALLARQVVVLEAGRVSQFGTPEELTADPANAFVARLTGHCLVPGWAEQLGPRTVSVHTEDGQRITAQGRRPGRVVVAVHPGSIRIAEFGEPSRGNVWTGLVTGRVPAGDRTHITVGALSVDAARSRAVGIAPGTSLSLTFANDAARAIPVDDIE